MLRSLKRKKKIRLFPYISKWFWFLFLALYVIIFWSAFPLVNDPVHEEEEGFTIIIQAWTRYSAISGILANYDECSKSGVPIRGIHIISPSYNESNLQKYFPFPVVWNKVDADNPLFGDIQRRFLLSFEGINTRAILHVDDDILPECSGLYHGFKTWKRHRDQIVGYIPRLAMQRHDNYYYKKWIFGVWKYRKYNIILTKYAFLHIRFMKLYRTTVHPRVKDFIREHTNCEDISMQFLVSSMTKNPPVFVAGAFFDYGAFHGISTGMDLSPAQHFAIRDECIRLLSEVYGVSSSGGLPLSESSEFAAERWSWWVKLFGWFPNSRFEYAAF
jgi:hypothetical protein